MNDKKDTRSKTKVKRRVKVKVKGKVAKGIKVEPFFTKGRDAYDGIKVVYRDVKLMGAGGRVVFEQEGVEAPDFWSEQAVTIAAQKYFRGEGESRERSVFKLVDRIANTITDWGVKENVFATEDDARNFNNELRYLLIHQMGAFNSPVWFNVGVEKNPQGSACFILEIKDTMESILETVKTEGMIFKYGSGTGVNISTLRSSKEPLSGGGRASGPVSFMRGFDAFAGVIKSGGKTRRAAKMVIMNADHPDIFEFVESKAKEERKAKDLIRLGYSGGMDGEAYSSVFFQNANLSVRVTDDFMKAVEEDRDWELKAVTTGETIEVVKARDLWNAIAQSAWECGDPGLQYHDTINAWHTCKADGEIVASNPCSEFMFLNNSACNLASLNLLKFYDEKKNSFDVISFAHAVRIFIIAQDLIAGNAGYPTKEIERNSKIYRPLGIGYANLGALIMRMGYPYDSVEGRSIAAAVTAVMTGEAWRTSVDLARDLGPFERYQFNRDHVLDVLKKHRDALHQSDGDIYDLNHDVIPRELREHMFQVWNDVLMEAEKHGVRNAQVSLLAPTGTIGLIMDVDSTGIEPLVSLRVFKALAGGGILQMVSKSVEPTLKRLGYSRSQIEEITKYVEEHGTIEGAPFVVEDHYPVFDTALKAPEGERVIHYDGHLKMMAAVQPFLSGAISKTVNLPREITVEEIADVYFRAWKMGLKAVALYRDGSKEAAPLTTSKDKAEEVDSGRAIVKTVEEEVLRPGSRPPKAKRNPLPPERISITHKFEFGAHEGYITVGYYENGAPGEVFVKMSKQGSTIAGLLDAFSIVTSIALQHGVELDVLARKMKYMKFEPDGFSSNFGYISSVIDYVFKWLEDKHPNGVNPQIAYTHDEEGGARLNCASDRTGSRSDESSDEDQGEGASLDLDASTDEYGANEGNSDNTPSLTFITGRDENRDLVRAVGDMDAPFCPECGFQMVRDGHCHRCPNCGANDGCSG